MQQNTYLNRLYPILSYIVKIHLLGLLFLTLIRGVFLISNLDKLEDYHTSDLIKAFFLGANFDNVIISFVSLLPLLSCFVITLFNKHNKKTATFLYNVYYILAYAIVLGITIADIPYYHYFLKHLDISIKVWMQYGGKATYSMLITETSYLKYYLLFFITIFIFSYCIILFSKKNRNNNKVKKLRHILIYLFILIFIIPGLLNNYRIIYDLKISKSYFCMNTLINETSISPTYYFAKSMTLPDYYDMGMDSFISEEDAVGIYKQELNGMFIDSISPFCREVITEGPESRLNVILVLMESMSSYNITEKPELTPFLNELITKSYYFESTYSVAAHTNQGIFSTLYGIPAFFSKNIMDNRGLHADAIMNSHIPICEGLPYNLNKKGYDSKYFMTHTRIFDNMDVFLSKNGYKPENIFSQENYPEDKGVNDWGVDDEFLLEFAENELKHQQEPFFYTIMTVSNHPPYSLPADVNYISKKDEDRAIYYADRCIKRFMENVAREKWFDNSIFVFIGDHGKPDGKMTYTMSLPQNHVPLIIYSPSFADAPKRINNRGSQIDVFPTVMGLLNINYENNSMGIDLLRDKRNYVVFSNDNKLGLIDDNFLYCFEKVSKQEYLYDYKNNSEKNIFKENKDYFDKIRIKAAATFQASNYMLKRRLTSRK